MGGGRSKLALVTGKGKRRKRDGSHRHKSRNNQALAQESGEGEAHREVRGVHEPPPDQIGETFSCAEETREASDDGLAAVAAAPETAIGGSGGSGGLAASVGTAELPRPDSDSFGKGESHGSDAVPTDTIAPKLVGARSDGVLLEVPAQQKPKQDREKVSAMEKNSKKMSRYSSSEESGSDSCGIMNEERARPPNDRTAVDFADSIGSIGSIDARRFALRAQRKLALSNNIDESQEELVPSSGSGASAATMLQRTTTGEGSFPAVGFENFVGRLPLSDGGTNYISPNIAAMSLAEPALRRDSHGSRSGFPGRSVQSSMSDPLASLPAAVARLNAHRLNRPVNTEAPGNSVSQKKCSRYRRRSLQVSRRPLSEGGSLAPLDAARAALNSLEDMTDAPLESTTGGEPSVIPPRGAVPAHTAIEDEGDRGLAPQQYINKRGSIDTQTSLTHEMLFRYHDVERARSAVISKTPLGVAAFAKEARLRDRRRSGSKKAGAGAGKIFDDPSTVMGYASVPILEMNRLDRGGLSLETKAVGRIQFGIPPETIKDSMRLGIEVPRVYIVPVERFCREMGPALGINVAEFEFPAYFNYFVRTKRCTLVVESEDAEANIRRVFGETLMGPAQFRDHDLKKPNEEEDFDPRFPVEARPNFYKEFCNFRKQEATKDFDELCLEMLVEFCHYTPRDSPSAIHDKLGVPPTPPVSDMLNFYDMADLSEKSTNPELGDSKSILTMTLNESSTMLSESQFMQNQPAMKGKRYEAMKERAMKRRHTTWLEDSDSDGDEDTKGPGNSKGKKKGTSKGGDSNSECRKADCKGCNRCSQNGKLGEGCSTSNSKDGGNSLGGNSLPEGGKPCVTDGIERRGLRRVVSNPDFRTNSSRQLNVEGSGPDIDVKPKLVRRKSVDSADRSSAQDRGGGMSWTSANDETIFPDSNEDGNQEKNSWMYSQAKWLGDVATIYPVTATAEDKQLHRGPRVEIFKMTGGTEYIVHDVDENNIIVGKARFSGTVRVPDEIAVEGFIGLQDEHSGDDLAGEDGVEDESDDGASVGSEPLGADGNDGGQDENDIRQINIPVNVIPPTFHPPSFGVTVLGNSHGFDKNGSTSGYVLWVNGRGVMIDPPPYSSATLEREGIRPRMIIAIIITHCHADHDAGAFQKVMTGSRIAVITTPTIYKSFIRKYAALSGLSPELLRHSHRHRPAIVGQPLKFQGATFHFTYTLHTIPCIAFKVEWRGRSMVFTGDHMNIPDKIDQLEKECVLTKERADNLRQLPLLDCDLLLHESGAPPIHTPLEVLVALPKEVKDRLWVVHTSALPKECGLRVAPTGTAGTFRLDELHPSDKHGGNNNKMLVENKMLAGEPHSGRVGHDPKVALPQTKNRVAKKKDNTCTTGDNKKINQFVSSLDDGGHPNVSVAGDFISSIKANLVATGEENKKTLAKVPPLVLSRPTCVSDAWFILNLLSAVPFLSSLSYSNTMEVLETAQVEVFCKDEVVIPAHRRSDVLCVVWEGTCVEREPSRPGGIEMEDDWRYDGQDRHHENTAVWHAGDWTGPKSLQPECALSADCKHRGFVKDVVAVSKQGVKVIMCAMKDLHEILKSGSPLYRKYLADQQNQAENAALKRENTEHLQNGWDGENARPSEMLLQQLAKQPSLNFMEIISHNSALGNLTALQKRHLESLADGPRYFEPGQLIWQVGAPVDFSFLIVTGTAHFVQTHKRKIIMNRRGSTGSIALSERLAYRGFASGRTSWSLVQDKLINVSPNSEYARLEIALQLRVEEVETEAFEHTADLLPREERMRNARDRFANKVLARLYARRAFTAGVVFSRGHFLSDTSRMVSGSLAFIQGRSTNDDIRENFQGDPGENHFHTSNIAAGPDGCVVMVFPRESLVSFLDAHPGVLLSLLGTNAIV